MADIRVRDVNDGVIQLLKAQAIKSGKTWQEFLHEALTETAMRPRRELVAMLKQLQDEMREHYGVMSDSTPGIRAARDGLE